MVKRGGQACAHKEGAMDDDWEECSSQQSSTVGDAAPQNTTMMIEDADLQEEVGVAQAKLDEANQATHIALAKAPSEAIRMVGGGQQAGSAQGRHWVKQPCPCP